MTSVRGIRPNLRVKSHPIQLAGPGLYFWDNCSFLAEAFARQHVKGTGEKAGVVECTLRVHQEELFDLVSPRERSQFLEGIHRLEGLLLAEDENSLLRIYEDVDELDGAYLIGLWVRLYVKIVEKARRTPIRALRVALSLDPPVMNFVFNGDVYKVPKDAKVPKVPGLSNRQRKRMRNDAGFSERMPNVGVAWVVRDGSAIVSSKCREVTHDKVAG